MPTKFFALTFAVTWTLWIAGWAISDDNAPSGLLRLVIFVGTFAPAMVALSLTARAEGREGALDLLRRLFVWRVGARWYVFAIVYMATIKLTVALVHRIATGAWPRFGDEAWYVMAIAIPLSVVVGGQTGEEIGWRGYALPRLAARFGMARASVLLGVVWAVWHLPLFFVRGIGTTGQSFPVYLLSVTAISVAMAWLFVHTNGSLLLAMLMHSAVNQTINIVPSAVASATNAFALSTSLVAWMTAALLWICAAYFLVRMRATHPERRLPAGRSAGILAGRSLLKPTEDGRLEASGTAAWKAALQEVDRQQGTAGQRPARRKDP